MEFEHIFRGTPAEFGVAVKEIDWGFSINGARNPSEGKSIFAIGALRPDANPVSADLFLDDDIEGGSTMRVKINAHKLPNGRSQLSGHVDTLWPEALKRWEYLEAELSRQGWIDTPASAQINSIDKRLELKKTGRRDAKIRVALAFTALEMGKKTTRTSAARWANTTTDSMKKYEDDKFVKQQISDFKSEPKIFHDTRNKIARRKKSKELDN